MDSKLLEHFENLFLELKKNTVNEMNLENRPVALTKGDEVDISQEERERHLNLKLLGRHSFMLKKIDNALLRIKNGTFGICDECDGAIEINRLYARPVATQCISCKEEQERAENQVLYEKRSHTHGKGFGNNVIAFKKAESTEKESNVIAINGDHF